MSAASQNRSRRREACQPVSARFLCVGIGELTRRTRITLLSATALALVNCVPDGEPPKPEPPVHYPIRIAVFQDKSASANSNRTPQLLSKDLRPLVNFLLERGGELAYGTIGVESNRSLLRLKLNRPPQLPTAPLENVNAFEYAALVDRYEQSRADYEANLASWQSDAESEVENFFAGLEERLSEPAVERKTDIWGAIHRGHLFLSEPDDGWSNSPHLYLILISDAQDTRSKASVALEADERLLLVNGAPGLGSLADLNPVRFESIGAALTYVIQREIQN